MAMLFDDVGTENPGLKGKSVIELLRLVADEEKGYKSEAMEIILAMGLETNYPLLEQAVRNDDDADLRNSAMEVLVKFGKASIPRLSKLLRDKNEEVRNFSCVMLGDIGSREAVGPLIQALADQDANVSHGAAEALGKIGDRAALMPLVELLKGEFWQQYAAIAAIGAMRDYRAVPHLLQLLGSELLAAPVIDALGKIGDPRTLHPLCTILPNLDDRITGQVAKAIVAIYLHLNETLSYKNTLAEFNQPEQLKQLISGKGVEKLRSMLTSTLEREHIEAAVTILGWIGEVAALSDFFSLLDDSEYLNVVESAILAIGKPAIGELTAALDHENVNVRIVAIRSLRWLGATEDTGQLAALLDFPNKTIQLEALESLKNSPPAVIMPRLFELVEFGDDDLAARGAEVLAKFPFALLHDFLKTLSQAKSADKRKRAAMLLGLLRDCGSPILIDFLGHDEVAEVRKEILDAVGRQQVKSALPHVLDALSDPDAGVREKAIETLAAFGDPSLVPHILDLLGTCGELIDYAVIKALGKMRDPQSGSMLMDILSRGNVSRRMEYAILEALGSISYKPAAEVIVHRYTHHPDPDIRRLAVETLGNLGDQFSLEEVEKAIQDPHWSVRIAALHVLGKIGGTREIPLLIAAMEDRDVMVKKHAIITLGELRNITTVPDLVKQMTDMEMSRYAFEALLKFGRGALPWLHRLMKKDYPIEVRERVVDLIGKIGDRKSVEPLMDLLEDSSVTIRLAAIDSLAFCFDSVLLKRLTALKLRDPNDDVKSRADLALKTLTMETFF